MNHFRLILICSIAFLIIGIGIPSILAQEDEFIDYIMESIPKDLTNTISSESSYSTNLFTGSAGYTYTIDVPPGRVGFEPPVFLTYSSMNVQDKQSVVGAGWSLNLNYIKRDVNYTVIDISDDTFDLVLNGQQYELVYNSSDNLYHTKEETFAKIERGTSPSNIMGESWNVTLKNGVTYTFGMGVSAEQVATNGAYVSAWYLSNMVDTHGNKIYYQYKDESLFSPYPNDSGATYLTNIVYQNQDRSIQFTYDTSDKPLLVTQYDNGNRVQYSRLLKEIRINTTDSPVSVYRLNYIQNPVSKIVLLSDIQKFGSDGIESEPITTFSYYDSGVNWVEDPSWEPIGQILNPTYGYSIVDVNGDGLSDILHGYGVSNQTEINNGNGWDLSTNYILPGPLMVHDTTCDLGDIPVLSTIDVNSDGLIDLISPSGGCNIYMGPSYMNTGNGWIVNSSFSPIPYTDPEMGERLADVNGDGEIDVLHGFRPCNPKEETCDLESEIYINNGNADWYSSNWDLPVYFSFDKEASVGGLDLRSSNVHITDVNADGLPDFVSNPSFCNIPSYINNGSGWIRDDRWNLPSGFSYQQGEIIDINGDSLPDLVYSKGNTVSDIESYVWINRGDGWGDLDSTWTLPWGLVYHSGSSIKICSIIADVNGDGQQDIYHWDAIYLHNGNPAVNRLKSIHTSGGEDVSISYAPSTSFPNVKMGVIYPLVKTITRNNGMSLNPIIDVESYDYEGGKFDYEDQEFRGFAKVSVTEESLGNRITVHQYHQDDALKGKEKQLEIYNTVVAEGNLDKSVHNTWSFTENNGIYTITLDNVLEQIGNGILSRTTAIDYRYDQFGNIKQTLFQGDTAKSGDEKTIDNEYQYNELSWILDRVSHTVLSGLDGLKASEVFYQYNNKGDLIREEHWLNTGTNPITQYTPDSYGNVISSTDPRGNITTFVYDATHTFRTSETNARNHVTSYQYDRGTGNLLQIIDPNGNTTRYGYDKLGRLIKVAKPGDNLELSPTISYVYERNGTAPESVSISMRKEIESDDTFDMRTFYDGFGQQIMTRQEASPTKQIVTETLYDSGGRKIAELVPYFMTTCPDENCGSAQGWIRTSYEYDTLDRITKITNPDTTFKQYVYARWESLFTDENGNRLSSLFDAYGRTTQVEEVNGTEHYLTKYSYNPLDKITQIQDNEGNIFQFGYDSLGRKTSQNDPDSGIWSYTYDPNGNLQTQTDARGITTEYTYDQLNRKTKIQYPHDPSVRYTYDQPIKGTLSQVDDANGVTKFNYDNRMRKTDEIRTVNSKTWTTAYSYDDLDRLTSITYPSGEVITYSYNDQGLVDSVTDFLLNIDYNALNQITLKEYGNGVSTTLEYNPNTNRLSRIVTSDFQDLHYSYDNVGNVIGIDDKVKNRIQTFQYDDLNRLIKATSLNSYGIIQYDYTSIGNLIVSNTNGALSTFKYGEGSAGPHALTSESENSTPTNCSFTVVFEDDFDDYTSGQFPTGWGVRWDGVCSLVNSSQSHSTPNSFKLVGTLNSACGIQKQLSDLGLSDKDEIWFEVWVNPVDNSGAGPGFSDSPTNPNYGRIQFSYYTAPDTGISNYYITVAGKIIGTYTPNQWYKVKVYTNLATYRQIVWVNDVIVAEDPTEITTGRPDTFYLSAGNEHSEEIVYYDDVKIGYGRPCYEDSVPPSAVSHLINTTYLSTSIQWNWTDPTDSDFDNVMIEVTRELLCPFGNGPIYANVSRGSQSFNATGLEPNTSYKIATRTVDSTGNINTTWVNHTAMTRPVEPLIVAFICNPISGNAPLNVSFNDTSTGPGSLTYQWIFSDNPETVFTERNLTHTFTTSGFYDVNHSATNSAGIVWKNETNYITVTDALPVTNFNGTPRTGTAPLPVTFNDTSTGTGTFTYRWIFSNIPVTIYTTRNCTHTFANPGSYHVNHSATNSAGTVWKNETAYITVTDALPVTNFNGTPRTGTAPLLVTFNDTSTGTGITAYRWIFGDSATIFTTRNLTHTFTNPGSYHVNHSVTNSGGTVWKNMTSYITVTSNPVPRIATISPTFVTAGIPGFTLTVNGVNFTSTSIVRWNGVNKTTTFVSGTKLNATIPAGDIATQGTRQVTVFNPAPGGGTSNSITFTVNPPPKITSYIPTSGKRGAAAFKFFISGSGFQDGATISLTKTGVPTIEATSVSVSSSKTSITCMLKIPSSAPTGSRSVVVKNPDGINATVSGFTVK